MKKEKMISLLMSLLLLFSLPICALAEDIEEIPEVLTVPAFEELVIEDASYAAPAFDEICIPGEVVVPGEIIEFVEMPPAEVIIIGEVEEVEPHDIPMQTEPVPVEDPAQPLAVTAEIEVIPAEFSAQINGHWLFGGDIECEAVLVGYELYLNNELAAEYEEDVTGEVNDGSLELTFDTSSNLDFPLLTDTEYELDVFIKFVPDYERYLYGDETDVLIYRNSEQPTFDAVTATVIPQGLVKFSTGQPMPDEQPETIDCDINGDGEITSGDLTLVKALILGKIEPTEAMKVKADINGDGVITSGDLVKLKALALQNESIWNEEWCK